MDTELKGLEGWLYFVGFGVIGATAIYGSLLVVAFFSGELLSLFFCLIGVALWGNLAWLFFKCKTKFVPWYIGATGFNFLLFLVNSALEQNQATHSRMAERSVSIFIAGCIWIAYMLRSRRVKATFVN